MDEPHSAFSYALQPRAVLRTALRVAKVARLWESFEKGANLYRYQFPLLATSAKLRIGVAFEQIIAEFEKEFPLIFRQKTSIQLDIDPVLCVGNPLILLKVNILPTLLCQLYVAFSRRFYHSIKNT